MSSDGRGERPDYDRRADGSGTGGQGSGYGGGGGNRDIIDEMRSSPASIVNLLLVAANVIFFLIIRQGGSVEDANHMITYGASYTPFVEQGQYWRLFTSMFVHFGWDHLFNNMLLLFFVGYYLEQLIGRWRYLIVYLGGGLIAGGVSFFFEMLFHESVVSGGASGAVFAVLGGLIIVVILNRGRARGLTIGRLLLMVAFSIYVGFRSQGVDNAAHIGGLIGGLLLTALLYHGKRFRPDDTQAG